MKLFDISDEINKVRNAMQKSRATLNTHIHMFNVSEAVLIFIILHLSPDYAMPCRAMP